MKLYIKENVFSWGNKFTVKGEHGNDQYVVEGEVFTLGKKLHVYDLSGKVSSVLGLRLWQGDCSEFSLLL